MTEQELRALVRDAIARHGASAAAGASGPHSSGSAVGSARLHMSHLMFSVPGGSEGDGACIIEPAVACNHCGYCKSLGH
jgi:hypothetical protein